MPAIPTVPVAKVGISGLGRIGQCSAGWVNAAPLGTGARTWR